MASGVIHPYPPLRFVDKVLTTTTWICAVALFATVGWMAMSPNDPRGAVSLVTRGGGSMVPQLAALAAGVAAVVTVVIGRKLPDAGAFAVAVGLAAANLQGENATYVLTYVMDAKTGARGAVCGALALESVVWFVIIAMSALVSGLVMRWCYGRSEPDARGPIPHLAGMAIADVPLLGRRVCGSDAHSESTTGVRGLLFTLITVVVALLLIRVLSAGSSHARAVQHGQVYFAVAASFFVGHWVAGRFAPANTALWGCLAVPAACIIGYAWTGLQPTASGPYAKIASVPPTAYMRALPLEYISVGTAAVLVSFWSGRRAVQSASKSSSHAR